MLTSHKCSYRYSYMTLAGHCIGFHRTEPFQEEKQQQMNVLYNPSLALALISLSSQPETSELPPLHFICMLCGLWPLLFSGALMWNCTGQSAAPCPAVSAGVSCGVWAEADGPGVQGVPVPQCSPASSPALRTKCRGRTRGEHMVTRDEFPYPAETLSCSPAQATRQSLVCFIISCNFKTKCVYIQLALKIQITFICNVTRNTKAC